MSYIIWIANNITKVSKLLRCREVSHNIFFRNPSFKKEEVRNLFSINEFCLEKL